MFPPPLSGGFTSVSFSLFLCRAIAPLLSLCGRTLDLWQEHEQRLPRGSRFVSGFRSARCFMYRPTSLFLSLPPFFVSLFCDSVAFARAARCRAVPAPCPAPLGAARRLSPSRSPSSPTPTRSCTSAAASAETRWPRCVRAPPRAWLRVLLFVVPPDSFPLNFFSCLWWLVCPGGCRFVLPWNGFGCDIVLCVRASRVALRVSCIVTCMLVIARCNRTRVL